VTTLVGGAAGHGQLAHIALDRLDHGVAGADGGRHGRRGVTAPRMLCLPELGGIEHLQVAFGTGPGVAAATIAAVVLAGATHGVIGRCLAELASLRVAVFDPRLALRLLLHALAGVVEGVAETVGLLAAGGRPFAGVLRAFAAARGVGGGRPLGAAAF